VFNTILAKLKKPAAQLSDDGHNTDLKIVTHVGPQPAHEIADIAREAGADLIVVGCRGHTAIPGLVLGTVTQRLPHEPKAERQESRYVFGSVYE
jgi:nucleotide-binding universal stress UspA family protein